MEKKKKTAIRVNQSFVNGIRKQEKFLLYVRTGKLFKKLCAKNLSYELLR